MRFCVALNCGNNSFKKQKNGGCMLFLSTKRWEAKKETSERG